jgi:hypothetical protein
VKIKCLQNFAINRESKSENEKGDKTPMKSSIFRLTEA